MKTAIQEDTLKALISARAVREIRAARAGAGWVLSVRLGAFWQPVRSRREPLRVWSSLTALGRFCDAVGIKTVLVEL